MDWEDAQKPATTSEDVIVGATLERHSVGELEQRIKILEVEIERVRAELESKRAHEARAASIFK